LLTSWRTAARTPSSSAVPYALIAAGAAGHLGPAVPPPPSTHLLWERPEARVSRSRSGGISGRTGGRPGATRRRCHYGGHAGGRARGFRPLFGPGDAILVRFRSGPRGATVAGAQ
jgi:hypothetical protein